MPQPKDPVEMAVIGAAQGLRGEVRVKSFTADPMALGGYGPLYDATGRIYEVLNARPDKTVIIVRFKGIDDRTAAEALNGTRLFVDRSQLPADLDADEFYHADLIGMEAYDDAGMLLGRVTAIFDFGGGDMLEIGGGGRKSVMLPFTQAAVPVVDPAARRLTVDRIAAGLVEEDETEGGEE